MADREKVIAGLEECLELLDCIGTQSKCKKYVLDALELLKEQEAEKIRQRPERLLPCKCGCKRREHWYGATSERSNILKCCKCGFEVAGKNEIDVHAKWNKAVGDESDA